MVYWTDSLQVSWRD